MQTVTLDVFGMFDALDHLAVEKQLLKHRDVMSAQANPASDSVTIIFDETQTNVAALREVIKECGFHCIGPARS